jgi:membrane fusion protein (multidrug efflux system)
MAAARDQAARIVRGGSETAQDEAAPEVSAQLADQLRTHVAEEARRRPAEAHGTERPAAPAAGTAGCGGETRASANSS